MICHELQEPIPAVAETWSHYVEGSLPDYDIILRSLGNIEKQLITARADLKEVADPPLPIIMNALLPLDEMLEGWRKSIPSSWAFKTYKRLPSDVLEAGAPLSQYHVYTNLYIAVIWNAYRSYRLLIHETIMSSILKCRSVKDMINLQLSMEVIRQMTDGICQSVPYCLLQERNHHQLGWVLGPSHKWEPDEWSTSGALLLFWPLFSCGMLSTTQEEQRRWITRVLRGVGTRLGMALAISMATAIESVNVSLHEG